MRAQHTVQSRLNTLESPVCMHAKCRTYHVVKVFNIAHSDISRTTFIKCLSKLIRPILLRVYYHVWLLFCLSLSQQLLC